MNVRAQHSKEIPLAVDLDGTLVSTDLLWESVFLLLRKNPLFLFLLPIWLLSGKAHLKSEIARRVTLDAAHLPYRQDFLAFLYGQHASGRELVLATAAAEPFAKAVATQLGIFSAVHSTSPSNNLAAQRKASLLSNRYGPKGFDYAGNDHADVAVFEAARNSIVVAPDTRAHRYQRTHGCQRFDAKPTGLKTYIKMLRVHQWLKNLLVFAPAVLAHNILDPQTFLASFIAFVAFSISASAIYILNDIIDLPLDRQHPTKRNRPFASGQLSIPFGLSVSALLLLGAAAICFFLPPMFAAVIAIYLVTTTAYSLVIKRMLLLDVICLAGLYGLRLLGGKAAASLPLSFWLMAFALFFFLSLAFVKRYVELQFSTADEGDRIAGRGYRPEDIQVVGQSGVASAFAASLVLSLYIQSSEIKGLYSEPWLIWPLVPIVLYINMRVWILAHRREMVDDPVVFMATDWRSQLFIGLGALLVLVATIL
ncbi:UbiA family prenyltransferase [Rhizobium sp. ARZ01]|uniref:UbiA family prenyltransferase n=1 Tax=Rhizobium sp. ARZ01 TaxID=2769313 RepID=UPI00177EFC4C|nr:UbiA family prenyltransferase [Rhizobium sp. ARZ01]MBD9375318.1 UbiA family prenyltransferase [Rhizobium sp. ARZ01]